MNLGNKVWIQFKHGGELVLNNVSKISYTSYLDSSDIMIKFESDIHSTYKHYLVTQVNEFETVLQTDKAKNF